MLVKIYALSSDWAGTTVFTQIGALLDSALEKGQVWLAFYSKHSEHLKTESIEFVRIMAD